MVHPEKTPAQVFKFSDAFLKNWIKKGSLKTKTYDNFQCSKNEL